MAGLKDIKLKIQSVQKTGKVTRAMEAVSAVKMRKAQERALAARPYARIALRVLRNLSGSADMSRHWLTMERTVGKVAIVIITSDKGLAGSLNSAVIKKADTFIRERGLTKDDLVFVCLGKRGYEYAVNRGYEVVHHELNVSETFDEDEFTAITDVVMRLYGAGVLREVRVAYTNFRSTFEQSAVMHHILPLSAKILTNIVEDILPTKGKYASLRLDIDTAPQAYLIEPNAEAVLDVLLPKLVNIAIFHKLLESKASEHSARMVAMKSATDKSKEVAKSLNLKYNKARQAAITREVSEIVGGIEAMK